MKQEFSPAKGNALHETWVRNATESASPEYAGQEEAMDFIPYVVVKLEDDGNSSDSQSEAEWTRPMESSEDEGAEQGQTSATETSSDTSEKRAAPKREYLGENGKQNCGGKSGSSQDAEDDRKPKKKSSKRINKRSPLASKKERTKKPARTRKGSAAKFSKKQEALMQAFVESHAEELFGPKRKGAKERKSLWEDLVFQVNAEGAAEDGRQTVSSLQKWAFVFKKAGIRPKKEPSKRKTNPKASGKVSTGSLDESWEGDGNTSSTYKRLFQNNCHPDPAGGSRTRRGRGVVSGATGASAPYSRLQPGSALSPQEAAEPDSSGKAPCCEKLEGAMFQVLNFCKFMHTTIKRLEEKIDLLQSNPFPVEESHLNFPIPEEVSWFSGSRGGARGTLTSGSSRFRLNQPSPQSHPFLWPRNENSEPAPVSPTGARRGRPRLPRPSHAGKPTHLADFQLERPKHGRTKRGGRRGRGRSRGGAARRPAAAAAVKREQAAGARLSVAVAKDDLPTKEPPKAPISTASTGKEVLVPIGSASRKVQVSTLSYLKAFKEADPQAATAVILRAVFPDSVLVRGGITGNPTTGEQQLDPNKIEAIREWLAEMFPKHNLDVRGVEWAGCLGAIRTVIRGLRNAETEPDQNGHA